MREMSISEARNHLPRLISEMIASREEVVIKRHGRPVAKLVLYNPEDEQQYTYPLRGLSFQVEGDFDAPLPDMWEALLSDRP